MSTTIIIILCVVVAILLLLTAASFYFYNIGIARKQKKILTENPDLMVEQFAIASISPSGWLDKQPFENIEMKSFDGLTLRAYYLQAKVPTEKTAILVHGYGDSARGLMVPFAQLYHETFGFNVLIPDNRGHGESEGSYIGFGWPDRLDYLKWIAYVIQKVGQDAQIVLHGVSMGGATVLMTSGEQLPNQVKCIISDCAYTSVTNILSYQLKQMYKLPPFPMVPLTSLLCKLRAGYFFGEASALLQVSKSTKPILFIHGAEDSFVPTEMIHPLYDACNVYKEKFLVPGAEHGLAYETDKVAYAQKVQDFLQRFFTCATPSKA